MQYKNKGPPKRSSGCYKLEFIFMLLDDSYY